MRPVRRLNGILAHGAVVGAIVGAVVYAVMTLHGQADRHTLVVIRSMNAALMGRT